MILKRFVLCFFSVMVFTSVVPAQEVEDANAVLEMLYNASQANKSLMRYGRISALVRNTSYDENGQETRKAEYDVRVVFKGDKLRLESKEQRDNRQWTNRWLATEEFFKETTIGDPVAFIRAPEAVSNQRNLYDFLPSKNTAFASSVASGFINYPDDKFISRMLTRKETDQGEVFVLEMVLVKRPLDVLRYYMAPDMAGSVLKYENYHDFGQGHVLLRQDEAQMQQGYNGLWYLKQFSSIGYRPDGTLRRKSEIEIKNFDFTFEVLDQEFTWEAIGVSRGMKIQDSQLGISYVYDGPKESESVEVSEDEIPEKAMTILNSINEGKETREDFRNLYSLMNKSAPKLEVAAWVNSKPLKLEDLKGKIIVLDFWGINCGPCLGDIEGLNEIHKPDKSEPVMVIGVHHPGIEISEIKKVMDKYDVKYPVCIDSEGGPQEYWSGRTFRKYEVRAIPRPFLIDIEGNVRSVSSPVNLQDLETLIKEHTEGITDTSPSEPDFLYGLKVTPEKINLGSIPRGEQVERSVYIYKPDESEFTVKIESFPDEPATAQLVKYEQEGTILYELRIVLVSDFQGTTYSSEIKLTTNDASKSEIVIPITATIISESN